jgi:hypothetical protein
MNLRLDWCSHEAAKYAVEHWHYSKTMPAGKLVRIGVWEDGRFIGCVLFGRGAASNIARPYGLDQTKVVELVRVALTKHESPVSRIVAIALRLLRKQSSGLRLIVSYADTDRGHHGGIYQAGGWIYTGVADAGDTAAFMIKGKRIHRRSIGAIGGTQSIAWVRSHLDRGASVVIAGGKHKYLYPLDQAMREQIAPLSKPYPKRAASIDSDAAGVQPADGGATPTAALQTSTE